VHVSSHAHAHARVVTRTQSNPALQSHCQAAHVPDILRTKILLGFIYTFRPYRAVNTPFLTCKSKLFSLFHTTTSDRHLFQDLYGTQIDWTRRTFVACCWSVYLPQDNETLFWDLDGGEYFSLKFQPTFLLVEERTSAKPV